MEISYSTILSICQEMQVINNNIKNDMDIIEGIKAKVDSRTIWSGSSSSNYVTNLKKHLGSLEIITTSLELYISNMIKSIENYQALESQLIKEVSNKNFSSLKEMSGRNYGI